MSRAEGWEARLVAEIAAARERPWAWGSHDCATFAWACARATTGGPTRWDRWFGEHHTEDGALALLRAGGGLAEMLGAHGRVRPKLAQRGDLAVLRHDGQAVVGVVEGGAIWVAAAPAGLARLPLAAASLAWRV